LSKFAFAVKSPIIPLHIYMVTSLCINKTDLDQVSKFSDWPNLRQIGEIVIQSMMRRGRTLTQVLTEGVTMGLKTAKVPTTIKEMR